MPIPDTAGVPPWAEFNDLKNKLNELVAKYNNLLVNLDSLNVVSLTADHIDAGTINGNVVTIRSDLTAGAYVQIDGTGMKINDGTQNTFSADINGKVTMTGATIQSDNGYPKVVMEPDSDLFGAYKDVDNFIRIVADYAGSPALEFWSGGVIKGRLNTLLGVLAIEGYSGLTISSYGLTDMSSADYVLVPTTDWSGIKNESTLTLQDSFDTINDDLAGKATAGISTSLSGSANGGIAPGTVLMVSGGGTVTWTGISSHSHAQN